MREGKGSPSEGQRWETLCPSGEGATVSFIHSFIHSFGFFNVFHVRSLCGLAVPFPTR